ncbi:MULTISPECIES: hypothetical protein [Actinomadura]|uniref:hypothetical protein n=1 Tax=unclassified Actinomadura TaxID=2626254 RepID=UPI00339B307C
MVARSTLDRWIRTWSERGFDDMVPPSRKLTPRTPTEVLELAAALKRETPERTGAQIVRILQATTGWSSSRTLLRYFEGLELWQRPDGRPAASFGRFDTGVGLPHRPSIQDRLPP